MNFDPRKNIEGFQKELNQRVIFLMNMMMTNDWSSQRPGLKEFKSNARSNQGKSNDNNVELLELLKKTQSSVKSLENEFKKIESENLHQDKGSIIVALWGLHCAYTVTKALQ